MYTATVITAGILFHDYALVDRDGEEIYRLSADTKEIDAVVALFNTVHQAGHTAQHFPFGIVQMGETTSSVCGPKNTALQWGPILTGPTGMLEKMWPALLEVFVRAQNTKVVP